MIKRMRSSSFCVQLLYCTDTDGEQWKYAYANAWMRDANGCHHHEYCLFCEGEQQKQCSRKKGMEIGGKWDGDGAKGIGIRHCPLGLCTSKKSGQRHLDLIFSASSPL
jgi:hypothetical protein